MEPFDIGAFCCSVCLPSCFSTWCDGGPVGVLARSSFDLHKKYGKMFDSDYRPVDTLEVVQKIMSN